MNIIAFDNGSYHLRQVQLSPFTDGNLGFRIHSRRAQAQGTKDRDL